MEDEADVEGEVDVEEVGVPEEEDDESKTSSPHAYTSLLFVRPIASGASQMGKFYKIAMFGLFMFLLIFQKSLLDCQ